MSDSVGSGAADVVKQCPNTDNPEIYFVTLRAYLFGELQSYSLHRQRVSDYFTRTSGFT
jgi:hypothetical protein